MADMIEIIKRAAMEAMEGQKPAGIAFGTVESENPLEIRVEQKLLLRSEQLILPRSMADFELEIELEASTESGGESGHSHAISGKKTIKILNALKSGESVLLMRMQGGQKYIVLDRMVST